MTQSSLLKTALIGTNRLPSGLGAAPDSEMQDTWQALERHPDPAETLLQAAALEQACWQAGALALTAERPAPCASEVLPYVPVNAATAALDVLNGTYKSFIAEWVRVVRQYGLIATPRLLPYLLEYAEANRSIRDDVAKVVGFRGRWLAAKTGQWLWLQAPTETDQALWVSGTAQQRRSWLEPQMQSDPAKAADAIVQSWPGDSPDMREVFTELATIYPHAAHESWLQRWAIVDRRQSIRHAAIRALMDIPQSVYRKRCFSRARKIIETHKTPAAKEGIKCHPPAAFDPDWVQDGLREKPPTGSGPKAFWMLQVLGVIPLRDWPELLNHEAPLSLQIEQDWTDVVQKAWQASAFIHPDANSLAPLLQRVAALKDEAAHLGILTRLLGTVSQADVADLLEPLDISGLQRVELVLRCQPVIDSKRHPALQKSAAEWAFNDGWHTRTEAATLAGCCDAAELNTLLLRISELEELSPPVEEFASALEHRCQYLRHFDDLPKPATVGE